jgi:hypothetical protein
MPEPKPAGDLLKNKNVVVVIVSRGLPDYGQIFGFGVSGALGASITGFRHLCDDIDDVIPLHWSAVTPDEGQK